MGGQNFLFFILRDKTDQVFAVAVPGFPRGGANPRGGGARQLFGIIIAEDCMKMKEIGPFRDS